MRPLDIIWLRRRKVFLLGSCLVMVLFLLMVKQISPLLGSSSQQQKLHSFARLLNYYQPDEEHKAKQSFVMEFKEGPSSQVVQASHKANGVKFLARTKGVQEKREEMWRKVHPSLIKEEEVPSPFSNDDVDYKAQHVEQQAAPGLVAPVVSINGRLPSAAAPYTPERTMIHLDLKGAPPKVSYLKKIIKLANQLGANGILLEYEDMFPFTGVLETISATNHYSVDDIKAIIDLCKALKMEVIPLVQTFGHMEFILKLKQFAHLRDQKDGPESICVCNNQTMPLIKTYIDQVMALHSESAYLHIGCDEVYHMGGCTACQQTMQQMNREFLFVDHVKKVASYAKQHYKVKIIIWDDMLRNMMGNEMIPLQDLVEPMVWVYAPDVDWYLPEFTWKKYTSVFKTAWAASAFKGAHGSTLMVPPIRKHIENNISWNKVMANQAQGFKNGMQGLVITGWQRYDHFAILCEVLPVAIPSMAISLIAATKGFFNASVHGILIDSLQCSASGGLHIPDTMQLDSRYVNDKGSQPVEPEDPYLWGALSSCKFPGYEMFRLSKEVNFTQMQVQNYIRHLLEDDAWMNEMSFRRDYTSPYRVTTATDELDFLISTVTSLTTIVNNALLQFFDNYTAAEWIELHIYPLLKNLKKLKQQVGNVKSLSVWQRRPLEPLEELKMMGVGRKMKLGDQNKN